MPEIPRCKQCGVPLDVTSEHLWLNDGSIVQTAYPDYRLVFIETESFDPLYCGISELVGEPVEPFVVNTARRSTRAYMNKLVSDEVRDQLANGRIDIHLILGIMFQLARIMGYGSPELLDVRFEQRDDDLITLRYHNPCSVPLIAGTVAGTVESYVARPAGVTYDAVDRDTIDINVFPSLRQPETRERVLIVPYKAGPDEIELRRCPLCGGPAKLAEFEWDVDTGIIISKTSGRRMALVGSSIIEPVFRELEKELGESIPEVVVEAQRRFVRSGSYSVSEVRSVANMRDQLALRGIGCIKELTMGRKGVHMILERAGTPLLSTGMVQGMYELYSGIESKVEWELSEDGVLEVSVVPWDETRGHGRTAIREGA
jgi:hypothetical protein